MPRGDGTGPGGQSPGTGRGRGGGFKAGPGGNCICPRCGEKVNHQTGKSCFDIKCPKCGAEMTRE